MQLVCKKTYSDAHNEFTAQVHEIQNENINILKKYIKSSQQDQTNISAIKVMCESINKEFPELGDSLWDLAIDFIGSLAFRTTKEARSIIKKMHSLLQNCEFSSNQEKHLFIQKMIHMIKKCYTNPKRPKLADVINLLIEQYKICISRKTKKTSNEKFLLACIPNGTKNKSHIKRRDAVIEYVKKHPEVTKSTLINWVRDIKNGSFTLKVLEEPRK